ncbi:GNAT family N-acetyltransferase [Pararhodobacter marinus]
MISAPTMFAHEMPVPGPARDLAETIAASLPMLRTDRLLLRAPRLEDFALYAELLSGARGAGFGGPLTREAAWDDWMRMVGLWLMRGHGVWTAETRASDLDPALPAGQIAGFVLIGFEPGDEEPELGWILASDFEGRGLAQEAAQALLDYVHDTLHFTSLVSYIDPDNARSRDLARRLGARFDGMLDGSEIWRHLPPRQPERGTGDAR